MDRLNSSTEGARGRVGALEGRAIGTIQAEPQRENGLKENKLSLESRKETRERVGLKRYPRRQCRGTSALLTGVSNGTASLGNSSASS